ncbi:unnamed protein product [Caenorhabditis sp. 36 PRJEB53466]|nr:unnamed protein product [Caenorhabditis sp. 36 PRJEB53466]
MSASLTWRTFVRRIENMEFESKLRLIRRYPKRRLAIIAAVCLFFIFVFSRSTQTGGTATKEQQCSAEKLKLWEKEIEEFDTGIHNDSVEFVGNGFFGVDSLGQLRIQEKNRVLDVETNFYPALSVEIDGNQPVEVTKMTDFKNGLFKIMRCFSIDGECACVISQLYAHRTRTNYFVQIVQISNPTKSTVRLNLSRLSSNWWSHSKSGELAVSQRQIGGTSYAIVCTDPPGKVTVSQKREESLRFTCSIASKPTSEEASRDAIRLFQSGKDAKTLDSEHFEGWSKMHLSGFSVAPSKAPNTLNGDRINATKYILMSNLRAPTIEYGTTIETVKTLETTARKSELCYTGHSNLLFPSRLWSDWDTPSKLIELMNTWMVTFQKRGCSNLVSTGALGASQAFVQSLTASSYHDSHLEVALDAHDLHREMSFHGIPVHSNMGTVGTIRVDIRLDKENRPYFMVSSSNQLFACDGGCLDNPVSLGKTPTELPVKVTKPATSLLYIAPSRRHLELLKSAIHVSEVGSAPAHEDDVIEMHRSGDKTSGGLPTVFWVIIVIIIIAFHLFLAKIFWSEWRKGDMTPYNPYLRNRMAAEQRRLEIERKKQKLAELRSQRGRNEEARVQQLLGPAAGSENGHVNGGAAHRQTLTSNQVEEILREVGIDAEPTVRAEPPEVRANHAENHVDGPSLTASMSASVSARMAAELEFSAVQTATTDNKDSAIYSKGTQTDDERISVGEFSLGSQEFDYDDDLGMMEHGQFRGRAFSHDQESPLPAEEIAKLLAQARQTDKPLQRADSEEHTIGGTKKSQAVQAVPPLSDEEKSRLTLDPEFLDSFHRSCRVIGRALNEDIDIFINYTKDPYEKAVASDDLLHLAQVYTDEMWTAKRLVTGMAFSEHYPDLLAVSYGPCDVPNEPPGVIVVWNTKSKRITAEFIVYCQSEIQSVAFARFHAHLLLAGCESGQICVWDNRLTSRKLPINRSPLSTQAHTQPVSCLAVVGTRNAHNFVSLSRDGKICSWNVDNLTQPVDGKDLVTKEGKTASATRMSFPIGEMQTFVVGTDTGEILAASRNGADPAVIKTDVCYKGHSGTLTGIEFHRASGVVDFSHLFISSSHDWTIKLWSTKDANLKFSFESHPDLVLDVAWSPVHPAVFASIDADGNLFVWNLNEDVEGPVARLRAGNEGETVYMNRLIWSPDGKHVFVGDDEGRVHMYDVRESLYVLKSEEWNRFARVLSDMKESNEEAEKYNL